MFWISWRKLAACAAIAGAAASLLCGYEFVRSASQSLFIGAYGRERLPVVMALAPVGTLIFVYVYGIVLSRVGARRAIVLTCLGSAALMILCFGGIVNGWRPASAALYIAREGYIVLLVEQIWSFINSVVRSDEGRKLNGPICGVASLGAIAGGFLVSRLPAGMSTSHLVAVAAASLVPTALLAVMAYRLGGEPQSGGGNPAVRGHLALDRFRSEPVLIRLALLVVVSQAISTASDIAMSSQAAVAFPDVDDRTRWFGGLYARLNVWSAFFQFVAAPLLLRILPLRVVHVAIPFVHFGTALWVLARPSLSSAAWAYMAFKVLDYSLFRAAKELLYIPLSFDARYRAKEVIDSFVYRLSKGGVSAGLAVAGTLSAVAFAAYPAIQLAASSAWIVLALGVTDAPRPESRA